MESLTRLWLSAPSFQHAVRALLQLPESTISSLAQLDDPVLLTDDEMNALGIGNRLVLRAVTTIRRAVLTEEGSGDEAIEELLAVSSEEDTVLLEEKRSVLKELFTLSESYLRETFQDAALRTIFPVLEQATTTVDLRVIRNDDDEGLTLVPVLSQRLVFDEAILGSGAFSFQMSEQRARQLIESIQESLGFLEQTAEALEEWMQWT